MVGGVRGPVAVAGTLVVVALAACASDPPAETLTNGGGTRPPTVIEGEETKLDDAKAIDWLNRECQACHGVDAATGVRAAYHSAWPMPENGVTRSFLEVSELTPIAYQTIRHAALAIPAAPQPMPPQVPEEKKAELARVIDWFQRKVPYAVIDADRRYGNESSKVESGLVQFTCEKPSTLRAYLSRVTLGAFERPPAPAELGWFTPQELSAPVTKAQRDLVVSKIDGEWRQEMIDVGVRKLATVVGGGPGIRPAGSITAAVANDLRDELYQSFKAHYDTYAWGDFFTANVVMTSPATAPFYGCKVVEGWAECTMPSPRAGFFTTLGFLNSRPQSFLLESNNHGRVASLFFTLYGEALLAATDGPVGEATPPLPSCLEATDTRAYRNAPRGSAAVPGFGKVCQSCHVSRYMAAGSMLFRPFSTTGEIYTKATLGVPGSPDAALVASAIDPTWTLPALGATTGGGPVTTAFLGDLLAASPRPCVMTGKPSDPPVTVGSVSELAAQLIANRSSFARGFMRHAHRAFSNLTAINLEMGLRSLQAFEANTTKLPDLIKAYFATDTLACEVDR